MDIAIHWGILCHLRDGIKVAPAVVVVAIRLDSSLLPVEASAERRRSIRTTREEERWQTMWITQLGHAARAVSGNVGGDLVVSP
jgi:hypothetical protein